MAASKRKAIPKSVRFEVFKRDKFTCQYCGLSAPNVILEVDHITPVSKGGTNDVMNLITSCRDCNRGKASKKLNDDSAITIQKKQLDALQERRNQIEMMLQWRQELSKEIDFEIDAVDSFFRENEKVYLNEAGKQVIRKQIIRFGFDEVYKACEIAHNNYFDGTIESAMYALEKIGGICYNRKKDAQNSVQAKR